MKIVLQLFCCLLFGRQLCSAVLVDLSHVLDSRARNWPSPGYKKYNHATFVESTSDEFYYVSKNLEMTEHLGTHMDAPHHFSKTAWDLASIPLTNFIVPIVKLNVREKCAENSDYAVTVEDLEEWEKKNGKVPEKAVILIETGWGDKYYDSAAYLGTDMDTTADDFDYDAWADLVHFPGISPQLATKLVSDYTIVGVGVDTASIDPGMDKMFPAHFIVQKNNVYNLENLCCLDQVPEKGATLIAVPPKMTGSSGFTLRVLADTDSTYIAKLNSCVSLSAGSMFSIIAAMMWLLI